MATHRVGETNLSGSAPSNHHLPYAVLHGISPPAATFMYGNPKSLLIFSFSPHNTEFSG